VWGTMQRTGFAEDEHQQSGPTPLATVGAGRRPD